MKTPYRGSLRELAEVLCWEAQPDPIREWMSSAHPRASETEREAACFVAFKRPKQLWALRDLLPLIMRESRDHLEVLECALMSSSALSKELNTPEEDEAWSDFNKEA